MDLFNKPELSRKQKLVKSRKATTDLTAWAIDYLNNSGCFVAWRQNNIPSTRSETVVKADGTKETKFHFKKNQITFKLLDIAAIQCDTGRYFELEVKTGADKLSPGQIERIKQIKSANGIAFAFSDKETFLLQIEPHMIYKPAF